MLKRLTLITLLVAFTALALAGTVQAKVEKFTFTNAIPDVTIYASLKSINKGDLTHCGYHASEDQEFLGYYEAPTTDVITEEDVKEFCVTHFEDRIQ